MIKEHVIEDELEEYQGKWMIVYILDNGQTEYTPKESWCDSKEKAESALKDVKKHTEHKNSIGINIILCGDGDIDFICPFNSTSNKNSLLEQGYPACVNFFPSPVK